MWIPNIGTRRNRTSLRLRRIHKKMKTWNELCGKINRESFKLQKPGPENCSRTKTETSHRSHANNTERSRGWRREDQSCRHSLPGLVRFVAKRKNKLKTVV